MTENDLQEAKQQRLIVWCVALAAFLSSLDGNIVAIALPAISEKLNTTLADASRVMLVYLLFVTAALPMAGKLGSVWGAKRVFVAGFMIFCVGSLLCGVSPSLNMLVLSRIVQAVGGAALLAMGYALIGEFLPQDRRGGAMGTLGAAASVAAILGAPIGGLLTEYFGWHSVFLVNLLVGAVAIPITVSAIPSSQQPQRISQPFDWQGSLCILIALLGLLYGLNTLPSAGWHDPGSWIALTAGCAATALFVRIEKQAVSPIIPGRLFRVPGFIWANLGSLLISLILGGVTIVGPSYFEGTHDLKPSESGMLFGVWGVAMMIAAPISGKLSDRSGARRLCSLAGLLAAIPFGILVAVAGSSTPVWVLGALFGCIGFTIGMFLAPNSAYVMGIVSPELRPIAASTFNLLKSIGILFGIAVFSVLSALLSVKEKTGDPDDLTLEFRISMAICCALALAAAAVSMRMKRSERVSSVS